MTEISVCSHCGAEDTGGDDWAELDITMAPGSRSTRVMSSVHTQLLYRACPDCIAAPWAAALREVLAHPAQHSVGTYERCTILCTHRPIRRRGVMRLLGHRTRTTCPSCWNKADIEILDDYERGAGFLTRFLLRIETKVKSGAGKLRNLASGVALAILMSATVCTLRILFLSEKRYQQIRAELESQALEMNRDLDVIRAEKGIVSQGKDFN